VKRAVYSESGDEKPFISGYSNAGTPNFWDLSKELASNESSFKERSPA
jgi:3-mercaptopropionate dioxygenase